MSKEVELKRPKKRTKIDEAEIHEMVEKKAYEIYENRGIKDGKALDDWLQAERMVRGERKNRKRVIAPVA